MKYNAETKEFTFTRKERYKIYSLMLEHLEGGCIKYYNVPYLCSIIDDIITELFGPVYGDNMFSIYISYRLKSLPELWAYNLNKYVWFKNNEERIAALKQCKKLTR